MVDPTSDRAVYKQVADDLRRRIMDGEFEPGERVPSETDLVQHYDVSRTTARQSIGVLRNEGLIVTVHGQGSRVRDRQPVRRLGSERYGVEVSEANGAGQGNATSFTHDQGVDWSSYTLDTDYRQTPASARLAELLAVDEGTMLLERRFTFRVDGLAQQLSTSYLIADMVKGTPVADPANEPWPGGNIAQLATLGVTVTSVREAVRSRMPTPEEARTLRMADGTPVLTVTRVMYADARPVEAAADIVIPADRVVLDYNIALPPKA